MYDALRIAVVALVLPPGGPIVLTLAGALLLARRPRAGRALVVSGAVLLWALSLPVVAGALLQALGGARALDPAQAQTAQAIVILGGGVRVDAPEFGGDTLGRLTAERVRYGAHLARQTGLPVLVTGGPPRPDVRAEADLMREALETEHGIAVRWVDDRARNTRQNAARATALLAADGVRRVLLVMHAFDVRRAVRLFERAGLEVVAAPTQVPRDGGFEVASLLPSVAALQTSHYALYEVLAIAVDRLRTAGD